MDGELTVKRSPMLFVAGLALGLAAGGVGGYRWAQRKLGAEFEERLEEETAKYKTFYTNVPGNKFATPQDAVEELIKKRDPKVGEALADYQGPNFAYHKVEPKEGDPLIEIPDVEVVVPQNVFAVKEDPDKPYIISQEMFMEGDRDYNNVSLTWYEKDNIVADDRDDQIENVEETLGLDFKVSFGVGSSDTDTVHVRNDKLGLDFEITKNDSSFGEVVLGLDSPMSEPKHSARQQRAEG